MPASMTRLFEWLAFLVHFFDEVEEHDDVADDDADETGDSEECHEAERRAHDVESDQMRRRRRRARRREPATALRRCLNWNSERQ